jgi:hypothetical protein
VVDRMKNERYEKMGRRKKEEKRRKDEPFYIYGSNRRP